MEMIKYVFFVFMAALIAATSIVVLAHYMLWVSALLSGGS